jgi:hypothetical protein
MDIGEFCGRLEKLDLDQTQQALAILWFYDEKKPDIVMSAGQLSRIIFETGLGSPHSTRLSERIKRSGAVISSSKGFRLKGLARSEIREKLRPILGAAKPEVDQELGYLPEDVWKNTRGYVEKVCVQLNGCFQFGFYDAASAMIRRLIETLIIECYEHLGRESEIKESDGNYMMLKGLVSRANDTGGLTLGRDAKKALEQVKELGDRSAHNRRYNAVPADLQKVQSGVRVAVDEMIALAELRRKAVSAA